MLAPRREELDLLDYPGLRDYIARRNPEQVICAAASNWRQFGTVDVLDRDTRMFCHVTESLEHHGCRQLMLLGSGSEYDKRRELARVRECQYGESLPAGRYGFSKYLCYR